MSKKKRNKKELLEAINKIKDGNDNTFLADIGAAGVGMLGAGSAAAIFGGGTATALFGLVAIPVAAPLAVVAGATVLGGAAMVGVKRTLFDGTYSPGKKAEMLRNLESELNEVIAKEKADSVSKEDKHKFHIFLGEPIRLDLISPEDAQNLMELVETGRMDVSQAYEIVRDILAEV